MGVMIGVLCIALGGVAAQWAAWRFRLPAIVLLFAAGLLFGAGLEVLRPADQFGPNLRPLVGLAVSVVVFEGGLALNMRELRAAGEGVLRLTIVALPLTWVLSTIAAHFITGMGWAVATLFGAITVVTGPTVVLPLLRHTRIQRRSASLLKWEAILNDPVGAILSAIVLEVLLARSYKGGVLAGSLAAHMAGGILFALCLGVISGLAVSWAFSRDQVPELLKTPLLLALAMSVYVVSNRVAPEAGLIAATLFGVTLANLRIAGLRELRRAKESLVVLIVSALFIVLTADLNRKVLGQMSWNVVGLAAAMLFVVRPAAILASTLGTGLTMPERLLAAWIAPRGVVAAAVAGVSGSLVMAAGYPGAVMMTPAVFAVIAATMVLHGFSLPAVARALGLTLGDLPVLAIVGASPWSTDMAATLHEGGVPVLLIDTFPGALDDARERGLPVLQAEVLSEHGEEELLGRRVDYVFAATPDEVYNGLVCAHLAPELGRERAFQLAPEGRHVHRRTGISRESRGKVIGRPPLDFDICAARHEEGWRFALIDASTPLSGTDLVQLLSVRRGGSLAFASVESAHAVIEGVGDQMLVFAPPLSGQLQAEPANAAEAQS